VDPDPDPAFKVNPNPEPGPGFSRQKKDTAAQQFIFFDQTLQFTYP
jgi:hypothetical protein